MLYKSNTLLMGGDFQTFNRKLAGPTFEYEYPSK